MSDLKDLELGKFTFTKDPWGESVNMEWVEDGYISDFDTEEVMDIKVGEAETLITFLAESLNISLRDLAYRNGK